MNEVSLLILLLAAGMLLIGAEIFLPGAILGTLGGASLFAAVVVAFSISAQWGFYTAFGILILAVVAVAVWVKFFPKTSIGQKMTLSDSGASFKAVEPKEILVGKTGTAQSDLRPAGYAVIDGKRVDVTADGAVISRGASIKVIKVEGNRVIVRKDEA